MAVERFTATEEKLKTNDKRTKDWFSMVKITWLGHASFRIAEKPVVYIDPWKLLSRPGDADLVLISHAHYDHYSSPDIAKVVGPNAQILGPADVIGKNRKGTPLLPGQMVELPGLRVFGVPAYNLDKPNHPQANHWLGFILEIGNLRIFYAGDTDPIPEHADLGKIDVALLPVSGGPTLTAEQAAELANRLQARTAIPCHYGDFIGSRKDADRFAAAAPAARILPPGQSLEM